MFNQNRNTTVLGILILILSMVFFMLAFSKTNKNEYLEQTLLVTHLQEVRSGLENYYTQNGKYPDNLDELSVNKQFNGSEVIYTLDSDYKYTISHEQKDGIIVSLGQDSSYKSPDYVENGYDASIVDGVYYKIDPSKIEKGCFAGKDCIPSIDNPIFENTSDGEKWLDDEDVIFGIEYKDEKRAYPQKILNYHEIVNDTIAGDSIAITFCPLCGSAIAYERIVGGEVTEFGVSGKLHNSDLIMYDRNNENYWGQITGEAIVGEAAKRGEVLKKVLLSIVSWKEWKENNPNSQILSKNTGYERDYDLYPYDTYEENGDIYFSVQSSDSRLHPKEVVYGFQINEDIKAYTEEVLKNEKIISDEIGGKKFIINYLENGEVVMKDEGGNEHTSIRNFWFAWVAFYPDTELYE